MCALKDAADANQLNCGFSGDASITGLLEPVAAPPDLFQVFVMIYGKLVTPRPQDREIWREW